MEKSCTRCRKLKPLVQFAEAPDTRDGHGSWCRECMVSYQRGRKKSEDPRVRMFQSSIFNARQKGLMHSIEVSDIPLPTHCIYLGILIDYVYGRRKPNAPSIDRIDPSKGYVAGNIQVISNLANRMKQNATIEQLIAFARGVLVVHGGLPHLFS